VHCCFSEETYSFSIQESFELLCVRDLLRGGEKEGSSKVKAGDLGLKLREGAAAKDDSGGGCIVLERFHRGFGL
jgi:hypothetical protein